MTGLKRYKYSYRRTSFASSIARQRQKMTTAQDRKTSMLKTGQTFATSPSYFEWGMYFNHVGHWTKSNIRNFKETYAVIFANIPLSFG